MPNTLHTKPKTLLVAGLAMAIMTSGCWADQQDPDGQKPAKLSVSDDQPVAVELDSSATPAPVSKVTKMTKDEQVLAAREDLAKRLDIALDQVVLSGALPVTWRSGALGCPKPGMAYTQALVPGLSIMLLVKDRAYRYHASRAGMPFHCPDERAEPPSYNSGDA